MTRTAGGGEVSRRAGGATVAVAATVGVALVVLPLLGLLSRVRWSTLGADMSAPAARGAARLSLVCSLGATAAAVAIGLPLAWVLARWSFPGRAVVRACVLLPLVLPPVVGGVALLTAYSRRGLLGRLLFDWFGVQLTFTTWGAILAETFVALPFFVLTAEAALRTLDRRFDVVAATLGAAPWTAARWVTLRMVGPSLLAGAVLAWARALGEFGATLTFAGNVESRTRTLPLAVYLQLESDPPVAYAMSLALLAVSLVLIVALRDRWFRTA